MFSRLIRLASSIFPTLRSVAWALIREVLTARLVSLACHPRTKRVGNPRITSHHSGDAYHSGEPLWELPVFGAHVLLFIVVMVVGAGCCSALCSGMLERLFGSRERQIALAHNRKIPT